MFQSKESIAERGSGNVFGVPLHPRALGEVPAHRFERGAGRGRRIKGSAAGLCSHGMHICFLPSCVSGELSPGRSRSPSSHSGSQCCLYGDGFEILRLTFPALEAIQGLCLEVL